MQFIPRGIEVLVKKAAVDQGFRQLLLAQRSAAADEIGLALEPGERAMLDAVPAAQLEAIIDRTEIDPKARPALLGKAAAAMLLALGLSVAASEVSCTMGVRVDRPPYKPPASAAATSQPASSPAALPGDHSRGARPDMPPAPTGIRPDMPKPGPEQRG